MDYGQDQVVGGNNFKRRKIRKGTRSCWACKKRKVKCVFKYVTDETCEPCSRRGTGCVGQDCPEENSLVADLGIRDKLHERIGKIESMLELLSSASCASKSVSSRRQSYHSAVSSEPSPSYEESGLQDATEQNETTPLQLLTPLSEYTPISKPRSAFNQVQKHSSITSAILDVYPAQEDLTLLYNSSPPAAGFFQKLFCTTQGMGQFEQRAFLRELCTRPDVSTHPVLAAKHALSLCLFLQYLAPQIEGKLSMSSSEIMTRITEATVRLVTTNETLTGCLEGIECIMYEGIFQSNQGNLRKAWLAFRRAMNMSQLMRMDGITSTRVQRIDPKSLSNPTFLWFRIVYMDRFLSLMLGLHPGYTDVIPIPELQDQGLNFKLELQHVTIAGRMLELRQLSSTPKDLEKVRNLDNMLLKAAASMPDDFWLPPEFSNLAEDSQEAFWKTMRLADHLHHYTLVHLLHLPFLLRQDTADRLTYSRLTCINASREILIRLNAYKSFNTTTAYCRTSDFFALMAGITLLLAHIDSHHRQPNTHMAHQRLSDRAVVKQVLSKIPYDDNIGDGSMTNKSSHFLVRLLEFEQQIMQGSQAAGSSAISSLEKEYNILELPIPYFGVVQIAAEGLISKGDEGLSDITNTAHEQYIHSVHAANHIYSLGMNQLDANSSKVVGPGDFLSSEPAVNNQNPTFSASGTQCPPLYPAITADINDWAFQGVDAVFFDSLMRGSR